MTELVSNTTISGIELIRNLGLESPKTPDSLLERKIGSFEWANMATKDTKVGDVLRLIKYSKLLNPPRSGHLGGTWERIVKGGGGPLVLNQAIRQEGLGYPLIFDLNQTPTGNLELGDNLYFPGTVFNNGTDPTHLQLFTINNEPVGRETPSFTPLMLAKDLNGNIKPLSLIHRQRMEDIGLSDAVCLSDIVVQRQDEVEGIFRTLFKQIEKEDPFDRNPFLKLIVDRVVSPDGVVRDSPLVWMRDGYHIGKVVYKDTEALVDAIMRAFLIAAEPNIHLHPDLPEIPLISKEMIAVLMAVLDTDFYSGNSSLRPINPHFHWGAFKMAGAPPKCPGYFDKSVGNIREIMSILRAGNPDIPPVYYVLLPGAIFTLWPSADDNSGQEAMAQLIEMVHRRTDDKQGKPDKIISGVMTAVDEWFNSVGESLPYYLVDRFSKLSTPVGAKLPPSSQLVMPFGFDTLTFRQASVTVGALIEKLKNK